MSPRVRHTAVTAPQFENITWNHDPFRQKPRIAIVLQVQFQKHTIAECFMCCLMQNLMSVHITSSISDVCLQEVVGVAKNNVNTN